MGEGISSSECEREIKRLLHEIEVRRMDLAGWLEQYTTSVMREVGEE